LWDRNVFSCPVSTLWIAPAERSGAGALDVLPKLDIRKGTEAIARGQEHQILLDQISRGWTQISADPTNEQMLSFLNPRVFAFIRG